MTVSGAPSFYLLSVSLKTHATGTAVLGILLRSGVGDLFRVLSTLLMVAGAAGPRLTS